MGTTTTATMPTFDDKDTEVPVTILAKPSDHIEAYFENTEGLIDGIDTAFYSGKISVREVQSSAKREHADNTTAYNTGSLALAWGTTLKHRELLSQL